MNLYKLDVLLHKFHGVLEDLFSLHLVEELVICPRPDFQLASPRRSFLELFAKFVQGVATFRFPIL